jgi:hypothetical protein
MANRENYHSGETMRAALAILILVLALPAFAALAAPAAPYCLALRGNGDLAPAHWGALAQVVEKLGFPSVMAGGSSASINLFLLESVAVNPIIRQSSPAESRLRAGLLLKSIQAYVEVVAARPEWREVQELAAFLNSGKGPSHPFTDWIRRLATTPPVETAKFVRKHYTEIKGSIRAAVEVGLVDPKTFQPLLSAMDELRGLNSPGTKRLAIGRIQFYSGEIHRTITVFGKFNARTDDNLFFRSGLVNFQKLGISVGKVGSFYAGLGFNSDLQRGMRDYFRECQDAAREKTWDELRAVKPVCDQMIKNLITSYQPIRPNLGRERDQVGRVIPALPTTAVLLGSATGKVQKRFTEYHKNLDPKFGANFKIDPDKVKLGYWGPWSELSRVQANLQRPFRDSAGRTWDFRDDEKSKRFHPLGPATWLEVMSLSPAEPGLAPLQGFSTERGETLYSAGGWSDLHPAAVLKAAGCNQIVYVTRRGGETLFGQGVAKRLLEFPEVRWEDLATDCPGNLASECPERKASILRNNNGDPGDLTSLWSNLFNLGNPKSSFNQALKVADAVVCTDWNHFSATAKNGISDMIADSYRAPWAFHGEIGGELEKTAARMKWNSISPADNGFNPQLGYRPYAGCLPF